MPSTADASSRDLRDRPLFRVAALVTVLLVAGLLARSCGSGSSQVSSERAVELARAEASFEPDREQVRLVQRGIPPRRFWGVSLYDVGANGQPTRVEVFLVDARTGDVTRG
jgi:hypothetical protein